MTTPRLAIELEHVGDVTVVRLSSGKVNAMDVELLSELADTITDLEEPPGRPLVVTGAGRTFSAGVDLKRVLEEGPDYVDRLIPALTRALTAVFCYPARTVAAINGAAIAGGCVLACACDLRILHREAVIGANELTVGVPFPAAAQQIVHHACGAAARLVILSAETCQGEAATGIGLAHEVTSGDVVARAVEAAAATPSGTAYQLAKAELGRAAMDRIRAASDDAITEEWSSPATAARIRAHLERLRQRRP